MSDRILIVARIKPDASPDVARLFAASDAGPLPHALGVTRRHLFQYRDLYFHYAEFDGDSREAVSRARERDDFRDLSTALDAYITPYDPATWRSPADAMAQSFYTWTR
ncbi:TcmI family type II polyketide cyclase [Actinoplanes flavus]|uniref:TcmI family type II polyketide cyclase n=1 Tax=Actinoplanes flavus TaxID=2820290 RepID=UPI0027DD980A|nr:TcmI family type II polyketide cyclase [Actinoplanes flavus]